MVCCYVAWVCVSKSACVFVCLCVQLRLQAPAKDVPQNLPTQHARSPGRTRRAAVLHVYIREGCKARKPKIAVTSSYLILQSNFSYLCTQPERTVLLTVGLCECDTLEDGSHCGWWTC